MYAAGKTREADPREVAGPQKTGTLLRGPQLILKFADTLRAQTPVSVFVAETWQRTYWSHENEI